MRHPLVRTHLWGILVCLGMASSGMAQTEKSDWDSGDFRWQVSPPLLSVDPDNLPESPDHPWIAVKDPSVIRHDGKWHLFCTLRKQKTGEGRIRIGHCWAETWDQLSEASWQVLDLTLGYHGAPQIFYFTPHQKWYLIYQAEDQTRGLKYGPCFSTNDNLEDASSWTRPEPLYRVPEGRKAGLDFWVICDERKAHLFFTSLNGKMWRAETAIDQFPDQGWSDPVVALEADIFEASHTYKLLGQSTYLTFVEAQAGRRRYFKAFTAEKLDGKWTPLAASRQKPFVSVVNVINQADSWATSYSHGELIRAGVDQSLSVDPRGLQMIFQGANDREYQRGGYGDITWRLGQLTLQ